MGEKPRDEEELKPNSEQELKVVQPEAGEIPAAESETENVTPEKRRVQKDPHNFDVVYKLGKKLGKGLEKAVYRDELVPRRVIGIYHEYNRASPERAKADFYLQKILHMLYPNIILDISARYTDPQVVITPEIERSFGGKIKDFLGRKPSLEEAYKLLDQIEQSSGVKLDNINNFIYDKDNNVIYADTPWSVEYDGLNFSPEKLRRSIQNLPKKDQEKAEKYLERLIQLSEEWRRKYSKP